jgi:hypothetical protein
MEAVIVYDNKKDKELLNLVDSKVPIFIKYIDYNTVEGRKEAYQVKSHWAAKLNPFVVVQEGEKIIKVFYSESGKNAIQQLINYLNNDCQN